MLLSELLSADRVKVPLSGRTKNDLLRELVELVAEGHEGLDVEPILASVMEREQVLSTGIGSGVAIPHGKTPFIDQLVELVAEGHEGLDVEPILASVLEREQVLSTGIGSGVAIPHGKTPFIDQLVVAAGVAPQPVDFDALDGRPVQLFFLLLGPESASSAHVKALSRISRLLRRDQLRAGLLAARSSEEFLAVVQESEAN